MMWLSDMDNFYKQICAIVACVSGMMLWYAEMDK